MADEKLLTVREVSYILGISEKDVMDLAESGTIPAYKVGGVYLRFKKEQVYEHLKATQPLAEKKIRKKEYSFKERAQDFLYYNNFYIICAGIILVLLFVIFLG